MTFLLFFLHGSIHLVVHLPGFSPVFAMRRTGGGRGLGGGGNMDRLRGWDTNTERERYTAKENNLKSLIHSGFFSFLLTST